MWTPGQSAGAAPDPAPVRAPAVDSERVLKWTGVLLVVLAALFLVSTAVSRGWIGPELQLVGAYGTGVALVGGGVRLLGRNRRWGEALMVGGAVVLPVTATASDVGLDLLTGRGALALLTVTALALATAAWLTSTRPMAVATAVVSLLALAPLVESDLPILLVGSWVTAASLFWVGFGLARRWTAVRLVGALLGGFLLAALTAGASADLDGAGIRTAALTAGAAIALAGWLSPVVAARLHPALAGPGPVSLTPAHATASQVEAGRILDHRSLLVVPLGSWIYLDVVLRFRDSERHGWWGVGLAGIFLLLAAALAWWTHRWGGQGQSEDGRSLVASQVTAASLLLTVALAVAAAAPLSLVAIAGQAAALGLLGRRLRDPLTVVQAALFGAIALTWAGALLAVGLVEPLAVGEHVAAGVVVALTAGLAWYGHRRRLAAVSAPAAVVAWIGALLLVADLVIHGPQGQVVVSVLWAGAAVAALARGVAVDHALTRALGLGTLAVVVAKLLTVDLAEVDTLWRVGLFFVVGAGVLRLGYVLPRLAAAGGDDPSAPPVGDWPPPDGSANAGPTGAADPLGDEPGR
jgi:hypothetical protein